MSDMNAADSLISTTESVESTPSSFDWEDTEHFTIEPNEYVTGSTEHFDYETTKMPPRSARRKRHINFPSGNSGDNNAYTMEVMVAVDRKMQEYHGNNIQAYVLTLMSIVSNIYADASIGNSINVAVVHIFLLKDDLNIDSNPSGKCLMFKIQQTT